MNRPTDETTARVVAARYNLSGDDALLGPVWCNKTNTNWLEDPSGSEYDDPRDDTDSALELLGWLYERHDVDTEIDQAFGKPPFWSACICENEPEIGMGDRDYRKLPISGEPFRYAVIALVAEVIG